MVIEPSSTNIKHHRVRGTRSNLDTTHSSACEWNGKIARHTSCHTRQKRTKDSERYPLQFAATSFPSSFKFRREASCHLPPRGREQPVRYSVDFQGVKKTASDFLPAKERARTKLRVNVRGAIARHYRRSSVFPFPPTLISTTSKEAGFAILFTLKRNYYFAVSLLYISLLIELCCI